jgi:hypothetical protein
MASCYFCGTELPHGERIYRTTLCSNCGKPIKICLNCEFYDPTANYECREDIGEPVREKDTANFCEYFSARPANRKKPGEVKRTNAADVFRNLFPD